jgi:hypothetical protein
MATQDTTEEVQEDQNLENQVETGNTEDEQLDENGKPITNSDTEENEEGAESTEGDQSDGTQTEDEEASEFKKRFTQIKGDTPEEYLPNLEEAYRNSSTEAQRLAKEAKDLQKRVDQIGALVAKNPELAKALEEGTGEGAPSPIVDPALQYAREQMQQTFEREYNEFADLHPELNTDDELKEKVIEELQILADVYDRRGQRLGMAEGLKKAWISLGLDADDSKEKAATQAKQQAAKPNTQGKPKSTTKAPEFTDAQIAMAQKFGLSAEDLAKYSK